MKKILALVLAFVLVGALAACGSKPAETTAAPAPETEAVETVEETEAAPAEEEAPAAEEQVAGGWNTEANAGICYLSSEQSDIFTKAMEGYTGLDAAPIAVVATQVVAGQNLAYLCQTAPVVPDAKQSYSIVTVYADLEGNAEITDVKEINIPAYAEAKNTEIPEQLAGGWTVSTEEFTPSLQCGQEAFEKAMGSLTGGSYQPYICMATQVVAGTNYAFFCKGEIVTADPIPVNAIVFVYEDLDGNAEVLNIANFDVANMLE